MKLVLRVRLYMKQKISLVVFFREACLFTPGEIKRNEIYSFPYKIHSHLSDCLLDVIFFCAFNFWILVYSPLHVVPTIHLLSEMAVSRLKVI